MKISAGADEEEDNQEKSLEFEDAEHGSSLGGDFPSCFDLDRVVNFSCCLSRGECECQVAV